MPSARPSGPGSSDLHIFVDALGTVILRGALDMFTVRALNDALQPLYARPRPTVILDLTAVGFIDSMGLGALLMAWRNVQRADGAFALTGVGDRGARLLQLSGLDEYLPIYPSADEARRAFESPE